MPPHFGSPRQHEHTMRTPLHRRSPLLLAALLAACGPTTTAPPQDDPTGPPELSDLTGEALAATTLGPDPYEVGTSWYDYTQRTHVLTPRDHVYLLRRDGQLRSMFEVESYYDERGESGVFTLRARRFEAQTGQWSAPARVQFSRNIKEVEQAICLGPELDEVSCEEGDEAFLVFRIVRRALPDAGFAVKDPGIFLRAHHGEATRARDELVFIEASTLEQVSLDGLMDAPARPSSAADPADSRVGWLHPAAGEPPRQDIFFQVTTSLHAAQWRVTEIAQDDRQVELSIEALCQRVDFASQRQFDPGAIQSFTLTLPTDTPYSGLQVSLCDAERETVVSGEARGLTASPFGGLWQSDPPFDLFVEQYEGRVAARLSPGSLLWNWSKSEAASVITPSFEEPLDPGDVWDTFY